MTTYTWTTPTTFSAGQLVTATDLNPLFHDNMLFLHQAKWVHVYRSAAQSLSNTILTALTWDTEVDDQYSMHDNATNSDRLVAPIAGIYRVHAQVEFAANATGQRQVALYKNTTQIVLGILPAVTGGGVTVVDVQTLMNLAVNDYAQARALQSSGGSLNVDAGDGVSYFEMNFIGALV